ncbi:MAG: glycosyl hydrolase family 18 protein [Nitrosopumilaceae archaeon]
MNRVRKTVPIILGILILTGSTGFQFAPSIQTANAESTKRVVGYFSYWESASIDSIEYSKVTDIIYFHIWPNPDGTLDTTVVNQNDLNTIRDLAHLSGVNVLIAAGGGGVSDGFPIMAANSTARANFVSNVVQYVLDNDLDGIDINWETQINQEKIDSQDILLEDLSDALRPLGKLVTVATSGEIVELKPTASSYVDWVNVMAYDMNWGNAEHSTFDDSISALEMYHNEGISKEKLLLGIPFYGRDSDTNAIKYNEIVSICNPSPSDNNCNGYFFNGIDLVQQKTQYVLDNGYGGVMIWNTGQDAYDQTSLLTAINLALGRH